MVGHHPVRSYGPHCQSAGSGNNDCAAMSWLKPNLVEGRVAAYFCGHDHDMQVIKVCWAEAMCQLVTCLLLLQLPAVFKFLCFSPLELVAVLKSSSAGLALV
jgi:hypothetical protein